jgi:hypothetical protein
VAITVLSGYILSKKEADENHISDENHIQK